ncbi:MAG: XRE family transcriptional regulator [Eubacteriales bacterium]|nr:XRE family transcriptional regulator [Eubacteriales bacterium]MDD4390551.1 XRE family transcriptional regulator [Eubacteriales bacterium]
MQINSIIGENLKKLRLERNLSLRQLSEIADLSTVMLSQIEKGDANPTINTIWKITDALHVPYTSLLEKKDLDTRFVSKSSIQPQIDDTGHYRIFCYYANSPERNFELFELELDAMSSYTSVGHPAQSQEYIIVIEGELEMKVNDEHHRLKREDSLLFSSSSPHDYCNYTDRLAKAYIINYYPGL